MPVIVSKVKQGLLKLSAVDQDTLLPVADDVADVSCQVTNCRIEPAEAGSAVADQTETLGGCVVPSDGAETDPDRLAGTAISDHNVQSGQETGDLLVPFTWRNRNKKIKWEFIPRLDPSPEDEDPYATQQMAFEGLAICSAMVIGGEVNSQIDLDFSFDIVNETLVLPERYGGPSAPFAAKATKSLKTDS